MATFLDLPYELQHQIIVQCMVVRCTPQTGSSRVMRLKLVSKLIAYLVDDAHFTYRAFHAYFHDPEHPNIWKLHISKLFLAVSPASAYKILSHTSDPPHFYQQVCTTARDLAVGMNISGEESSHHFTGSLLQFAQVREDSLSRRDRSPSEEKLLLLAAAAYMNCVPVVRRLLEEGVCPWASSPLLGTPCAAAARKGNDEIMKIFLEVEGEADVQAPLKRGALGAAIEGGHISTLNLILDPHWGSEWISTWTSGPENPHDTFMACIFDSLKETTDVDVYDRIFPLIGAYTGCQQFWTSSEETRWEPHTHSWWCRSFTQKPAQLSDRLLPDLLSTACAKSDPTLAIHLLDTGACPTLEEYSSHHGPSPLWAATKSGSVDLVKILISRGANPSQNTWYLRRGLGPLRNACVRGDLEMVKLLVDAGADVRSGSKKVLREMPPIVFALQLEHEGMVRFLIGRGALEGGERIRRLAWWVVGEGGLVSMARLLLELRVFPTERWVRSVKGKGDSEMIKMLNGFEEESCIVEQEEGFEGIGGLPWLE